MSAPLTDLPLERDMHAAHAWLHDLYRRRMEATLELQTVSTGIDNFNPARKRELERELIRLENETEQARVTWELLGYKLRLLELGGAS